MNLSIEVVKKDKGSLSIIQDVGKLCSDSNGLVVKDKKTDDLATEYLSKIKAVKRNLEARQKEFTDGAKKFVKDVNILYKGFFKPVLEADEYLRDQTEAYFEKIDAIQKKEEEKILKKQEKAIAKGKPAPVIAQKHDVAKTIHTSTGASKTMTKRWTFEMVDPSKLKRKYLMVDLVSINRDVQNGVREIDGVRIFEKASTRV